MPAALAALSSACTRPAPPPDASMGSRPKNLRLPFTSADWRPKLGTNFAPLERSHVMTSRLCVTSISESTGSVRKLERRKRSSKNSSVVLVPKSLPATSASVRSVTRFRSSTDWYAKRITPPAKRELPPPSSSEAASSIATLAPWSRAASAAHSAALPLPTTTTSNASRTGFNQPGKCPHVCKLVDGSDRIGNRRDRVLAQHPRPAQLELAPQARRRDRVVGSAAERLIDARGLDAAIAQRDANRAAEVILARELRLVVRRDMDARQERGDARVVVAAVLEVTDAHGLVDQRPRKHVLQAELGVDRAAWSRPVSVPQPARVNPPIYPLDVLRRDAPPGDDVEHRVDRRMRAAAAGILLDAYTGRDDVEWRRPGAHCARYIIGTRPVEHFEEALLVLEHAEAVRREADLCQARRENAIASAVADMQRLRHSAEVRLDARGERRGERERHARPVRIQSHQARGRRGCAEGAERRGRMPALGVVVEVDGEGELGFDLESRDVGEYRSEE